jgi:predicted nucleic acid-binding protein
MRESIYFDTSALAKWYLNEAQSEDVEAYIQAHGPVDISDLTVVEMRCLLGRRRREGHIDADTELKIFATFQEEIRQGFLISHALFDGIAAAALNLLSMLPTVPLRTLDAFHLAVAIQIQAEVLASADRIVADAAAALDIPVVRFDKPRR